MTRILAILAHPNKESLNGRIFYGVVEHLKKQPSVTVDVLDLCDRVKEIPFYVDKNSFAQSPFYHENKERFMAADRIFMVYPVYWYAVPGILKCWFDMVTNYAWKFDGGYLPKPLHHITKAVVVNTASMPSLFRWFMTRNSATEMVKESLKFLGIKKQYFYEINGTHKLTEERVIKHISSIIKKSDWLIKS